MTRCCVTELRPSDYSGKSYSKIERYGTKRFDLQRVLTPLGSNEAKSDSVPTRAKRRADPAGWTAIHPGGLALPMVSVNVVVVSDIPVRWSFTHLIPLLQAPRR